ncbi:hypothetical protein HaLaN_22281, partial [Haematococcus lacustris]
MEGDPLLDVWDSMHRTMLLALCAVLGRQEEGLIMDQLISTCKAEAQQLAPLALDLVWGMDGMLQMMQQHWHMFWPMACED